MSGLLSRQALPDVLILEKPLLPPRPVPRHRTPEELAGGPSPGAWLLTQTVKGENSCAPAQTSPTQASSQTLRSPRVPPRWLRTGTRQTRRHSRSQEGRPAALGPAPFQVFPSRLSLPVRGGPDGKRGGVLPPGPDARVEEGPQFLSKSVSEGVDMRAVCDIVKRQRAGLVV